MNIKHTLIFTLSLFLTLLTAQQKKEYKIGLALSGGGAKGFAHVGVLKVLEKENIPISAISGVSMGSIVGALYSIGYSASELEKIALNNDWDELFLDEVNRNDLSFTEKDYESKYILSLPFDSLTIGLPKGLIQGYGISKLLARYTRTVHHIEQYKDFPIPFTCVATDLTTGEPHEFSSGYLPNALRASMAIPTLLTPQEINGKYYIDGFVSRNLPAENVKKMDVDIIIGSDVGENVTANENINSLVDVLNQTISYKGALEDQKQRELCNVLITPDMKGFSAASFDRIKDLIKLGEEAAQKAIPQIKKIIDSLNIQNNENDFNIVMADSIKISGINIDATEEFTQTYVLEELFLQPDNTYSITQIERAIDEIYATKLFDKISYKIIPTDKGNRFVFKISKRNQNEFRFGMNYNTDDKASLIFNFNFMNFLTSLNKYSLDIRLGEDTKVELNYYSDFHKYRKGGINLIAGILNKDTDIYENRINISRYKTINIYGSAYIGSIFSSVINTGIGARIEHVDYDITVSPTPVPSIKKNYVSLFTKFEYDNTPSKYFPERGTHFKLFGESYYSLEEETKLTRPSIRYGFIFKNYSFINKSTTFIFDSRLLLANKIMLKPFDYVLDITTGFYGVKKDELNSSMAFMGKVGSQFELSEDNYLLIEFNIGHSNESWDNLWETNKFVTGFGFTYAYNSIVGPLRITAMSGNAYSLLVYASVGFDF